MSTIADDYRELRSFFADDEDCVDLVAALDRIGAGHQRYLDACARVTDLANKLETDQPRRNNLTPYQAAREVRDALGDGYLGGPLL